MKVIISLKQSIHLYSILAFSIKKTSSRKEIIFRTKDKIIFFLFLIRYSNLAKLCS